MVVLDQFYQIIESRPQDISPLWKVAHVLSCFLAAVCGLLTAFTFGRVLDQFSYYCVLNAEIVFDNYTYYNTSRYPDVTAVRAIELTQTVWGRPGACNFAQFTPLVAMISAIVWGVYFGILSRGGAGYRTDVLSRPWSIFYPSIFFTLMFFIVYVISTEKLKTGMIRFCQEFAPEFNNTGCVPEINVYSVQFNKRLPNVNTIYYDFYANMVVSILSAEIGIWTWVVHFCLCCIRICCVTDFDLQLVTVVKKEEEYVEKVVEFADEEDYDEISEI